MISPYESNMDEVRRRLERVAEWASGRVTLAELMPPAFVSRRTPYPDLAAFLDAGGVTIESAEDLEAKEPQLDKLVRQHTRSTRSATVRRGVLPDESRRALRGVARRGPRQPIDQHSSRSTARGSYSAITAAVNAL